MGFRHEVLCINRCGIKWYDVFDHYFVSFEGYLRNFLLKCGKVRNIETFISFSRICIAFRKINFSHIVKHDEGFRLTYMYPYRVSPIVEISRHTWRPFWILAVLLFPHPKLSSVNPLPKISLVARLTGSPIQMKHVLKSDQGRIFFLRSWIEIGFLQKYN